MMKYSEAGHQRVTAEANRQGPQATLANSAGVQAATGGSAGMNVNSGGPHILLFERDQQFMALLTSELQLAGYECHPARTAVEVFDAIARYPIRLVLVNLAQAAASRREFWVALDAQRRGRGVQVLTFRCMNIAGYGADDPDDASRTVLTDMEVDGMLGVMNLVDAVRSRIPGTTTGSFSRVSASPSTSKQEDTSQYKLKRQAGATEPPVVSQTTTPLSLPSGGLPPAAPVSPNAAPVGSVEPASTNKPGSPPSGFTDRIRAVIYPSSRSFSPMPETNWVPHNPQSSTSTQRVPGSALPSARSQGAQSSTEGESSLLNRESESSRRQNNGIGSAQFKQSYDLQSSPGIASPARPSQAEESGLAQLFRMVREHRGPEETEAASSEIRTEARFTSPVVQRDAPQARPVDATSISSLPLRASPIQDIPIEREPEYRGGQTGVQSSQIADTSSSLSAAQPPPLISQKPVTLPTSAPAKTAPASPEKIELETAEQEKQKAETKEENIIARVVVEQLQSSTFQESMHLGPTDITSDDTLLSIVQSLPPMPAPPPQPQPPVLSGRATRSLGSVLLEGHLVPQHRLEVAQQIQRMLRGVDMNYQLGEILLMFKLLAPDQLLAASLVSYGLISAAQIGALGRIRQELHSIGLEYDLESLLVLFRILTPEQLREVRASWSG